MRCAVLVVALAACYHPNYEDCQVSCSSFGCPDGLTCQGGMCRTANAVGECAILPPGDGGIDGDGDGQHSGSGAVQIAAGTVHTCAACGDGSLWCWGGNSSGQTSGNPQLVCSASDPTSGCDPTPVQVVVPGAIVSLSAGPLSTCVVVDVSGTKHLFCMGDNSRGQLGTATPTSSRALFDTGVTGLTTYASGSLHACEIVGNLVMCQGDNERGQLGNGTVGNMPMPMPMKTSPAVPAAQLAAGELHTCATIPTQSPMCWGDNTYGQVNGAPSQAAMPQPRPFSTLIANEAAAGDGHTCLLGSDGTLRCFGRNDFGQVGNGNVNSPAPVTSLAITGISHIAAGGTQTCALTQDGIVDCWGSVQPNLASAVLTPTEVTLPMGATAITAGTTHACAILQDGSVWCWGTNASGELGTGTPDMQSHGPTQVHVCE